MGIPEGVAHDRLEAHDLTDTWHGCFTDPSGADPGEAGAQLINPVLPEAAGITHDLPEPIWWDRRLYR